MESEVKLLFDNGQRRLKYQKVNEPNANTFLAQCPICRKPMRKRKSKLIGKDPSYETYLQVMPYHVKNDDHFSLYFKVWIRDLKASWQEGGVYKVRLDIWDDFVNEGCGGYIRNPLLNDLHWHMEEPQ